MESTRSNDPVRARRAEGEALVRGHLERGDAAAATEAALQLYGAEVFRFLVGARDDAHVASEVYSDFCLDVWKGIAGFEWRSSFRTWIYRVAKRAQQRYFRERQRRGEVRLATGDASFLPQLERSRTLDFIPTALRDGFEKLRAQLDPEDCELLLLRIDQRLSFRDIAAVLAEEGASEAELERLAATLRMRLSRVKERLRELARREGLLERGDEPRRRS